MSKIYFHINLFLLGLGIAALPATLATKTIELNTIYLCVVTFYSIALLTWLILYFVAIYKVEDEQIKQEILSKLGFKNDNFHYFLLFFLGFSFALLTFRLI